MENLKLKDFDLKKSKLTKGIVEVEYYINFKTNGDVRHPKINDKIEDPHPDLINSLNSFLSTVLDIWEYQVESEDEVKIIGIKIKGKKKKLIIEGEKKVRDGLVPMDSNEIESYQVGELGKLYEAHKKEIFAALYEGKTAQFKIPYKENKKK